MDELTVLEVDAATGEKVIRPLTADEITEREAMAIEQEAREAEQAAKTAARESAIRKMAEASGLTDEELEAMLNG